MESTMRIVLPDIDIPDLDVSPKHWSLTFKLLRPVSYSSITDGNIYFREEVNNP